MHLQFVAVGSLVQCVMGVGVDAVGWVEAALAWIC
jgi:hypothetical protein